MPDQWFTCYIINPLMIISVNSHSWGDDGYQTSYGELVKMALKIGSGKRGLG
jgi:hypothetical protein